jgi:DNA-binding response OmpR family regulator
MKRILIVDDRAEIRQLVHFVLHNYHELIEAADAERALELMRQGPVDLVILDVMMPGGRDGLAVLEEIRANPDWRRTRVIMLTARDQPEDEAAALRLGADAYLAKPFSPLKLQSTVEALFADSSADTAGSDGLPG